MLVPRDAVDYLLSHNSTNFEAAAGRRTLQGVYNRSEAGLHPICNKGFNSLPVLWRWLSFLYATSQTVQPAPYNDVSSRSKGIFENLSLNRRQLNKAGYLAQLLVITDQSIFSNKELKRGLETESDGSSA